MKWIGLALLVILGCDGLQRDVVFVDLAASAVPAALPVGETTTVTVRASYPDALEYGVDDAYQLLSADIRIRSADPETLRPVPGGGSEHRWELDMPVLTQTMQFGFECLREGTAEVRVGRLVGEELESPQILLIECTPDPSAISFEDAIADLIDSISSDLVERDDRHVDITEIIAVLFSDSNPPRDLFSCFDPNVTCSGDLGEGPLVHAAMLLEGPVPEEPDHFLVYALVGQRDEDVANDWVAQSPFDWDLFQQTDWWLQLIYDPLSGWRLDGTHVLADQTTEPFTPNAVVVRQGARIDFFVPLADLAWPFRFRMTSFAAGDATYPEDDRAGDVSGADPTEPLLVLD